MSNIENPSLNDVMPANEQVAVWNAAIVAHFETQWAELQAIIAELKERPDLVTPEHVILVTEAIQGLMKWLRAHGIDAHFDVTEANGLDVHAGDHL
ncbi:hypothetical protein ABH924_000144 [Arthrobacter sp. GAS37]|uniref:hypothetical protein n=1 Tax=Arthrobacter sp. GAS37 TaxID=3156261 RepID=UPI003835205A